MSVIKVVLVANILLTFSYKKAENTVSAEVKPAFDRAKDAIEIAGQIFVMNMNKCDSITLANFYKTDAKMMGLNEKSVIGRTAIRKVFNSWLKNRMFTITIKTLEIWRW